MSKQTGRATAIVLAAGAILLGALASAPQAGAATLYACIKKNGTAHIYAKKPKCKKHETKLSWNTEGPAGKNGTNGANGKDGATGKEGPAGPANPLVFSPLPLLNSWVDASSVYNTTPVGYARDGFGVVHLQGGVIGTASTTNVVAELPAADRPKHEIYAISWGFNTESPAFVNVRTNGTIAVWDQKAGTSNVKLFASLDGVTYFAG